MGRILSRGAGRSSNALASLIQSFAVVVGFTTAGIALVFTGCVQPGVQGGSSVFAKKFPGISSVTVLSPTTVQVTWVPVDGYTKYTVYASNADAPLASLPAGSTYTVSGLQQNTTYSFSVVGTDGSGNQYGIATQIQATTWANFLGPTSASSTGSNSIALTWNYNAGPSFLIYYNAGSNPTVASGVPPKLNTAQATTSSPSGYTVSGLQPTTNYYLTAIAKYQDGTDSWADAFGSSGSATVQWILTNGLSVLPTISTSATIANTTTPQFDVSDSVGTFTTTFTYNALTIAAQVGNGTATASGPLSGAIGSKTITISVHDSFTNLTAYGAITVTTQNLTPSGGIRYVNATTSTSLNPIPTIAINNVTYSYSTATNTTTAAPNKVPIYLGATPSFVIANGQAGYTTTIYDTNNHVLGTVVGNGTVRTSSAYPMPRGLNTVSATVVYGGASVTIPNIKLYVKNVDPLPITPPVGANGGIGQQGAGTSTAVGDFNCDGYPDLAVGAPYGQGAQSRAFEWNYNGGDEFDGGVYIYYGTAGGLDLSTSASTTATGTRPLFIPSPLNGATSNGMFFGEMFGYRVATGNINGASFNGKPCSDLVVTAPGTSTWGGYGYMRSGAFYVYYGAPTGLQTGALSLMSFTCQGGGSTNCGVGAFSQLAADANGTSTNIQGWGSINTGRAVAVGDVNGDGYDDVIVSGQGLTDKSLPCVGYCTNSGGFFVYYGSQNGLSPNYKKVLPQAAWTTTGWGNWGFDIAVGYIGHNKVTDPAMDIIVYEVGPVGYGAVRFIPNTTTSPFTTDATGYLTSASIQIAPPQCSAAGSGGVQGSCGAPFLVADLNNDGFDDFVFTLGGKNPNNTNGGAIIVYYGSSGNTPQLGTPSPTAVCAGAVCPPQIFYRGTGDLYLGSPYLGLLGDVDNDGYVDIGVSESRTGGGKAFVFHGSATGLLSSPVNTFDIGAPSGSLFGSSIVGGKFNNANGMTVLRSGASYNDVVVGAANQSPAGAKAHGQIHVFANTSGFAANPSTPTSTIKPNNEKLAMIEWGDALMVGDLNGDGYGEIAASLMFPGDLTYSSSQWQGYPDFMTMTTFALAIYYGSPNGFVTTPAPVFTPLQPTDPLAATGAQVGVSYMGPYVIKAGDMNGDGFNDIMLCSGGPDLGTSTITVLMFYGSSTGLLVQPTPKLNPTFPTDPKIVSQVNAVTYGSPGVLGMHMAYQGGPHYNARGNFVTGDFNGDGYSDVVMKNYQFLDGAPVNDNPFYVIYGSPNGPVAGGQVVNPSSPAYAGSARNNQLSATPQCDLSGATPICYPLMVNNLVAPPSPSSGWGITSPGDMDGDGTDDLIVMIYTTTNWYASDGSATIYYGSKAIGIDPNIRVTIAPQPKLVPNTGTARQLSGACGTFGGDVGAMIPSNDYNGDGLADIVAVSGAENNGPANAKAPSAYVIYGVPGDGTSPTVANPQGPYRKQGLCATYPCTVLPSNVGSPDGLPNHVVDSVDNSCNAIGCNILRFWLPSTNSINGCSAPGDITGDNYGEVVIGVNPASTVNGITNDGEAVIYSGSATGLYVSQAISTAPTCSGGACTPFRVSMPTGGSYRTVNSYTTTFAVGGGTADIDGDGKKDFLLRATFGNDTNQNGFWTGAVFLFH
jgi:hypothetical protein